MGMTVGELVAYLGIDDSEYNTKLGKAETNFGAFGSKISGIASKLGSLALVGVSAGLVGIAGALGAGVVAGMKFNSSIEQTTIAMGTMLGSTDAAKTLIAEVTKMAAATPFEFPELADATKRLVAYGVAAGDAVPLMTRLGDISSALQIPIGELADIYGKMKVSGRITMEDMNQMAGQGIPIYTELAKVLGVNQSEIRGMVEAGKVGFPDIQKAIEGMTSAGGMFAGMMEKQSVSFAGLWSTLKDGATQVFAKLVEPAFKWLVETALPKAIELVGKFQEGLASGGIRGGLEAILPKETADQIISTFNTLKNVVLGVVGAIKDVVGVFISLPAPVQEAIIVVGGLTIALKALGLLSPAISLVGAAISGLAPAATAAAAAAGGSSGLTSAVIGAGSALGVTGLAVGALAAGFVVATAVMEDNRRGAESLATKMGEVNQQMAGWARTRAQDLLTEAQLYDGAKLSTDQYNAAVLLLGTQIDKTGETSVPALQEMTKATVDLVTGVGGVSPAFATMAEEAGKSVQQIVSDTKRALEPLPPWVEMTLKGFSTAIGAAYELGDQEAQRWAEAIRNDTKSKLDGVPGVATSSLSGLTDSISGAFEGAYNEAQRWATAIRNVTSNISPYIHMSPAPAEVIISGYEKLAGAMDRVWSRIETRASSAVDAVRMSTAALGQIAQLGITADGYFVGAGTGMGNTGSVSNSGAGSGGGSGGPMGTYLAGTLNIADSALAKSIAATAALAPQVAYVVPASPVLSPEAEARWKAGPSDDYRNWSAADWEALAQKQADQAEQQRIFQSYASAGSPLLSGGNSSGGSAPALDIQPLIDEMRGLRDEFKRQNNRALQLARMGATA